MVGKCRVGTDHFGYGNVAQVAHYLYDVDKGFEVNQAIRENMPMFVYVTDYINLLGASNMDYLYDYRENLRDLWSRLPVRKENREDFVKRWTKVSFGKPDTYFLKHYYKMSPYYPLMVRKDLLYRTKLKQN